MLQLGAFDKDNALEPQLAHRSINFLLVLVSMPQDLACFPYCVICTISDCLRLHFLPCTQRCASLTLYLGCQGLAGRIYTYPLGSIFSCCYDKDVWST